MLTIEYEHVTVGHCRCGSEWLIRDVEDVPEGPSRLPLRCPGCGCSGEGYVTTAIEERVHKRSSEDGGPNAIVIPEQGLGSPAPLIPAIGDTGKPPPGIEPGRIRLTGEPGETTGGQ